MNCDPIITTGLFAGRRLSKLPTTYLRLQLGVATLLPSLRSAIEAELLRRTPAKNHRDGAKNHAAPANNQCRP
jgi:hypothetical protein